MDIGVYNNLITTFNPKTLSNQVHKESELRHVVKQIRDVMVTSPVYLVDFSEKSQKFVFDVKDSAIKINETMQKLSSDSENSLFKQICAYSTDESQVKAKLVEGEEASRLPSEFTIQTKQLANSQVNLGKGYYETGKGLSAGSYQFSIKVDDVSYDFQYRVRRDANHRDIMEGLSQFITNAKIGVEAQTVKKGNNLISMRLESTAVGSPEDKPIFELEDKSSNGERQGLVEFYGLNNVSVMPQSAVFSLNGAEKKSLSNHFILGKAVEITLCAPSDEEAVIGYHPDVDAIMSGINELRDVYNDMVAHTTEFETAVEKNSKLKSQMKKIFSSVKDEMESCGLKIAEDAQLYVDESLARDAIASGAMEELFVHQEDLSKELMEKMDEIKINPVEYIDKMTINYPNFSKPATGYSYITSFYCGLLFSRYC